ncbi:SDR family NAD(P)-dependent oxidoreductase [Haloprofundus salinisoli]|uniref:SDR family NAD(P)-dependent oxidoreductase n=1 Tax=Haloprofundus salinisoli TaxID=2876193 RepID=UPI001CCF88F0|nr:SDR family oxidoreductase [Haloprofundus salinisoli]
MTVLDSFGLDGRTAIVTGGNRGIGREIADALAEAGANVVVANRDEASGETAAEELADEWGVETLAVPVDVADEAEVRAMVEATVDRFGGVDVLVNNAGIVVHEAAEEMTVDEWDTVMQVNVRGVFLCSKYAGIEMMDSGGTILNVSSMSARIANYPQRQVAYNASKGAVESFTRQLASEWAEHDIRVNCLAPGYIRTDNTDQADDVDPNIDEVWRSEMLMDTIPGPEAVAPAALYLASDASSYVTGASLVVDGGYTVR